MRLTLQVETGFQQGHRWQLAEGQSMTVGRTEWADVSCETDERMSRVHFQVTLEHGAAVLKDLNSTNGTRLNGQFISEAPLNQGDRIEAGKTVFAVEIEGGSPQTARAGSDERKSHQLVRDHKRTVSGISINYRSQAFESGLVCLEGGPFGEAFQPEAPAQIATLLGEQSPLTMLVDPQKTGGLPQELGPAEPLFDWLPLEVSAVASPLAVAVQASPELDEFVNGGWGNDALMILLGRDREQSLVNHLRAALNLNEKGKPISASRPPTSIMGYYYPSVLAQLVTANPACVDSLLQGIDAVFTETPGDGSGWRIYARAGFDKVVKRCGFFENVAV